MLKTVKAFARRQFPSALAAYHSYRLERSLRARKMRRTPDGFLFRGHEWMENGTFEQPHSEVIRAFAGPGNVFIDVGANFGYFTCMASTKGSHVVAIEPLQGNLEVMYENLEANGIRDVEVFPVGLAAEPGLAVLYGGGISASMIPRWAGTSPVWKRTIPLSTLDLILGDRFAGQPMMVKIDVEGMEHITLGGAKHTLARTPAPRWLVEICLTEAHPNGCNVHYADVFRTFWDHGYSAQALEPERSPVTPADVERWVAQGRRDGGDTSYVFEKNL